MPLGTFYTESPLVSRNDCQSHGMPEAQAEGHWSPGSPDEQGRNVYGWEAQLIRTSELFFALSWRLRNL